MDPTAKRKNEHIDLCLHSDVEAAAKRAGFQAVTMLPCALPRNDLKDIDTSCHFLGKKFRAPFFITGMTGGVARGTEINLSLAHTAARFGIPMGVGSQRIAVEQPELAAIFAVKNTYPDLFLIANLGVAQLRTLGRKGCQDAVSMIGADALAIHVNTLQEIIQIEGDRDFAGVIPVIADVVANVGVPVVVKEVGVGMDPVTARKLVDHGVACIDTGGVGGTSWAYIEGRRADPHSTTAALGEIFRDFGLETAMSLVLLKKAGIPTVTATGGIRTGLDVAKAVGLGAAMAGIGLPFFRAAALRGNEGTDEVANCFLSALKTTMICVGASQVKDLAPRTVVSAAYETEINRFANAYQSMEASQT